jgi:uncharacterized phage-like protein YoqJ
MELCREQTVCFTGHRQIPLERDRAIRLAAENTVRDLIMQGYDTFLVGGALGFDTLAQLTVIRLRREFPFLRVVMAIPCREQDSRWSPQDRAVYQQLCRLADETILLREEYTDDCMLVRNRYMVEHSSRCVACWDGSNRGGTAYTVRYARQCGVPVINLWKQECEQLRLY